MFLAKLTNNMLNIDLPKVGISNRKKVGEHNIEYSNWKQCFFIEL